MEQNTFLYFWIMTFEQQENKSKVFNFSIWVVCFNTLYLRSSNFKKQFKMQGDKCRIQHLMTLNRSVVVQ